MNHDNDTPGKQSRAGTLLALLVLLGAIALAAATTSGRTIFVLPIWLLVPCTLVTVAAALFLARSLQVTRLAALLTTLGALSVGITAGALLGQCTRQARVPLPAPAAVAYRVVMDALSPNHPEVAARARADAAAELDQGVILFQVPDYYEAWHTALIDVLESEGVRFSYVSSCHMSEETMVYNRAFNHVMRLALDERHQESGYISRVSHEVYGSHGSDKYYEPYIP